MRFGYSELGVQGLGPGGGNVAGLYTVNYLNAKRLCRRASKNGSLWFLVPGAWALNVCDFRLSSKDVGSDSAPLQTLAFAVSLLCNGSVSVWPWLAPLLQEACLHPRHKHKRIPHAVFVDTLSR